MAINTGGYQVSVMPQFVAPDPSLVAFNPTGVADGALAGLNLARTLEQLKHEREQNEEFAKTHDARVAMAKAQSALEVLKLDHKNAVRQAEIDAEIAEFKLKKALAPSAEKAGIAKNDLSAAQFGEDLKLVAPQAALTGLGIADKTADLTLKNNLRPATDRAASLGAATNVIAAESAFNNAPALAKAAATQAQGADAKARLANNETSFALEIQPNQQKLIQDKLADDLKFAATDADIRRAHDKADTSLKLAQAENYLAMTDAKGRYEKDPMTGYAKLETIESQILRKEQQVWNSEVTMPNGRPGTLAEYWAATREPGGEAKTFWYKSNPVRNPQAEESLRQLQQLKQRRAELAKRIADFDIVGKEAPKESEVKAGTIPAKGTKVKQGGVTYEFDGTSNIPKPVN